MVDMAPLITKLRKLGLTRSEAEAYLAAIQETSEGPVSAYKIAQSIGRDPANLAKTLTALEKHGAVRVVQEKPRLYIPVGPEDFTKEILANLEETGKNLVGELSHLRGPDPTGLNLALRDNQQALDQAVAMLRNCQSEALICASGEVMEYLAAEFGNLARRENCEVKFLGLVESGIVSAQNVIIPAPTGFPGSGPHSWLHLVTDRSAWLTAWFSRSDDKQQACGWWSDDPGLATIFATVFSAACEDRIQPPILSDLTPEILPDITSPETETQQQLEEDSKTDSEFSPGLDMVSSTGTNVEVGQAKKPDEDSSENPAMEEEKSPQDNPSGGLEFIVKHPEEEDLD